MATRKNPNSPKAVDSYRHDEKRMNIPTAPAATDFFDEDDTTLSPIRYPRDVSLDPQLVWKGKDGQNDSDLIVDAPPIYIQEKIVPRALVENLRRESADKQLEPEIALFEMFDDLDELSQVEFYQHQESWKNRMILGDSLQVMGSLAEREALRGKTQMIFIDPPYGIKFGSNWQVRSSSQTVRDGNVSDTARDAEQIKAFRDTWELGIHSYLSYLRDRLVVSRDLLTDSGSIFVQIGEENVHLVRSLLDEVFGSENFVREIVYQKTMGAGSPGELRTLSSVCDYIIWFAKDKEKMKYRQLFREKKFGSEGASGYTNVELPDGSRRQMNANEKRDPSILPEGSRIYSDSPTKSQSGVDKTRFPVTIDGKTYRPDPGVWKTHEDGMNRLIWANRITPGATNLSYVRFLDDFPALVMNNVWTDTLSRSMTDKIYVVQSATKVIERCMLMVTDPGDLVLDPTCGSGTTAYVAEQFGRRWITIDTSRVAIVLARQRLMGAKFPFYLLADSNEGRAALALEPAVTENDIRKGFVYSRARHITLKSIANNPDLKPGMSRHEIDAAILKHADYEDLVDRPKEDKNRVRVSGPFTTESLAPHRSVGLETVEPSDFAQQEMNGDSFALSVLENLRTAGIQNGRRGERLKFDEIEPYASAHIQAIGSQSESGQKIAIALGPQYGTVSASLIKNAAKEAVASNLSTVAVLGFAFDPQLGVETDDDGFAVVAGVRDLGKVKVLVVRMNVDLLMGDELKKTGAGNLFTVFGEPDLELRREGTQWVVEVHGVDVYDPTSGHVRSNSTNEIALWMVDSNYDGESFFVRQAYFLGDMDPFKALKKALKSEINADAWQTLYQSISAPFDTPESGKIAVKVINDYGDEVMKVLEIG